MSKPIVVTYDKQDEWLIVVTGALSLLACLMYLCGMIVLRPRR